MQSGRIVSGMLAMLQGSLGRRLVAGVTVGVAAYLLIQVVRIAAEASGLCTGCNAADSPDILGAAAAGGTGGALGGGGDPPGGSRFDNWLDNLLGGRGPEPSVEPVDPTPPDPAEQEAAREDQSRLHNFYKHIIGTEGLIDMPEGSLGDELNDAMDRVLDFSSGKTEVGPTPEPVDDP